MILMVYNRRQCREFLLPNLRNADYEIQLPWQEYGLTRRGPIRLEVTEKGWALDSTEDYQVRKNGQDVLNCRLKDQDILELRLADGNSVKVIVADADLSFIITRKYISKPNELSFEISSRRMPKDCWSIFLILV